MSDVNKSINAITNADFNNHDLLQIDGEEIKVVQWKNRPLQWLNKIWHRLILRDQNSVEIAKKIDAIIQSTDISPKEGQDIKNNIRQFYRKIKSKKAKKIIFHALLKLPDTPEKDSISPPGSPPPEIEMPEEIKAPPTPPPERKKSREEWIEILNAPYQGEAPSVQSLVEPLSPEEFEGKYSFHPLDVFERYIRDEYEFACWDPIFSFTNDDNNQIYERLLQDLQPDGTGAKMWGQNLEKAMSIGENLRNVRGNTRILQAKETTLDAELTSFTQFTQALDELGRNFPILDQVRAADKQIQSDIEKNYHRASEQNKRHLDQKLNSAKSAYNHPQIEKEKSQGIRLISNCYAYLIEAGIQDHPQIRLHEKSMKISPDASIQEIDTHISHLNKCLELKVALIKEKEELNSQIAENLQKISVLEHNLYEIAQYQEI